MPGHAAARALLGPAGTPVAAPSANPFGYVSPTTAEHVIDQLGDKVDLVLDGGPCRVGVESTIVSLLTDEPPVLLRPGGVAREDLEAALGQPWRRLPHRRRPLVSRPLARHYATRTPLRILPAKPVRAPREGGSVSWPSR